MEVVKFSAEYQKDVEDLVLDVYENELGFRGYERPDLFDILGYYLGEEGSGFWVALEGGQVVGTVGVLNMGDGVVYLKRMVVKREFRGKGVGSELLNVALSFAKESGAKVVYAGTVEENVVAIEFYKRQGFVESGVVPEGITAAEDSVCFEMEVSGAVIGI